MRLGLLQQGARDGNMSQCSYVPNQLKFESRCKTLLKYVSPKRRFWNGCEWEHMSHSPPTSVPVLPVPARERHPDQRIPLQCTLPVSLPRIALNALDRYRHWPSWATACGWSVDEASAKAVGPGVRAPFNRKMRMRRNPCSSSTLPATSGSILRGQALRISQRLHAYASWMSRWVSFR